jgi:hypothetical protein
MRFDRTQKRGEQGQSLTELAISIVVIFVILAGLVDLGRMYFHYIGMRDAAQEAASYGAVFPTHCDQIRERAWVAMNSSPSVDVTVEVDGKDCTSANPHTEACHGNALVVTLRDPNFPITMPFIGTFLGRQTISLQTTITDTILRPPCQ